MFKPMYNAYILFIHIYIRIFLFISNRYVTISINLRINQSGVRCHKEIYRIGSS